MTPETLRLDRIFKGVGRIARATGTTNPAMRRKISRMLTALYEEGRLDVLRAIRDGKLEFLQVYDAYQRRALEELPVAATMQRLGDAMQKWTDSLLVPRDASAKHVSSLETSRRYFERENAKAMVSELPQVLEALRAGALGIKHPRSFNLARAAALAFVRATLKRSHPLWLACAAVEPRKVDKATTLHRPLSVEQLQNVFPDPDTNDIDAIAWAMATTGMHQEEYWGRWATLADRVHIEGTKRRGRVRDVPLVRAPIVPRMHRRTFENKLRKRTTAITPRDLRRTYANWLEAAGVPRTRRKLYLGHGAGDVTGLYELHEVAAFLAEDAQKLRVFLGAPTEPHTMTLHKAEGA